MSENSTFNDAINYIMSALPMYQRVGKVAYKANLDNTIALLDYLDNPQKKFQSIHIAGTNGKGSVSHCLASVFQESGYKTGLYTSPHLTDFRERIRINGIMIEKSYVTAFIRKNKTFLDKLKPSFFEMSVGLCFQYFADRKVDVAIIETGMGGRLDSTNIIMPELSVITNIGFDHTAFLGNTLEKIAAEKAGIIKSGVPVVIGETQPAIKNIFINAAKKNKSPIIFADGEIYAKTESHTLIPPSLTLRAAIEGDEHLIVSPLAGIYQIKNLKTVLAAAIILRKIGYKLHIKNILKGITNVVQNTGLRGRWMVFDSKPVIVMDTGHNADGLNSISQMLKTLSYSTLHMVIGMVDDKDHSSMLQILPGNAMYYFCKPNVPRGFDAKQLLTKAQQINIKGHAYKNVESAVNAAMKQATVNDVIFIGGSTFTVADALTLEMFTPHKIEKFPPSGKQIKMKL
ncbi:MAG: folylpolyglutamate synthase/dihydrofolate synthase family protein [Bacteroidales bacterium]